MRKSGLVLVLLMAFGLSAYLVSGCGSSSTATTDAGCSTSLPCTVSTNVN